MDGHYSVQQVNNVHIYKKISNIILDLSNHEISTQFIDNQGILNHHSTTCGLPIFNDSYYFTYDYA
jgi:hypothetical protein